MASINIFFHEGRKPIEATHPEWEAWDEPTFFWLRDSDGATTTIHLDKHGLELLSGVVDECRRQALKVAQLEASAAARVD